MCRAHNSADVCPGSNVHFAIPKVSHDLCQKRQSRIFRDFTTRFTRIFSRSHRFYNRINELRLVQALQLGTYQGVNNMSIDFGLLVIRILFGMPIATHGAQKLFGWFGGYGLKGTGGFFEAQLGFRPGVPFAAAAGLSEMGGGILLTLGLLTPFGSAAVLSAMLVAIVSVHIKNGFFAMANGFELPFLYAASAVGLAFSGPGAYSFDSWLGLTFLNEGYLVEAILVLAVLGAAATLASRRQVEEQASAVRN